MNQFEILGCLGKGAYSTVFKIKQKSDQNETQYAMKVMKTDDKYVRTSLLTEIEILKNLKSPFIVELICDFRYKNDHCLVLEYLSGGDLNSLLTVEYLHNNDIVHGDIKPGNILIDAQGHLKITDFGVSSQLINGQLLKGKRGTFSYMAPEILLGEKYGTMVDWWSAGVMFYKMLVDRLPFTVSCCNEAQECCDTMMFQRISNNKHLRHIPPTLSENAVDFLVNLLTVNQFRRLGYEGAKSIQKHNFFAKTDWNTVVKKSKTPPFIPSLENTSNVSTFTAAEKNGIHEQQQHRHTIQIPLRY